MTTAERHAHFMGRPCACGGGPNEPTPDGHLYTPQVLDKDRRVARLAGRRYVAAKRAAWGTSDGDAA
jgi:hypothetical protein